MKRILFSLLFLCLVFSASTVKAASSWQQLGDPISEGGITYTSMVTDSHDVVYAAYLEYSSDSSTLWTNRLRVEKYENGVWSSIGDFHVWRSTSGYQGLTGIGGFHLKVDSNDQLYLAYYGFDSANAPVIFVERYTGSGWQDVGGSGSTGMLLSGDVPDEKFRFEIGSDDTLYIAYIDGAITNNAGLGSVVKIFKYTGNLTTDSDGKINDGWEYAFSGDPQFFSAINFSFSVGLDNEIYLAYSKNMGAVSPPDVKLYVYKYDTSWVALSGTPFEIAGTDFYLKAGQNEAYLFLQEEVLGAQVEKIKLYSNTTKSWQTITSNEDFLNNNYSSTGQISYTYFWSGDPFAFDASGDLNFVYGNTSDSLVSESNPWGSATVMKYTSSQWEYVGSKRFSDSMTYLSVAATSDNLYVMGREGGDSDERATVYEFAEAGSVTEPTPTPPSSNQGSTTAADSGEYGASPVTGQQEAISEVSAGQFIRSSSFADIYYVDENLVRHPFWNATIFFTYADSWNEVIWVTDATLPTMTLGSPMLPKEDVVLVKIQSDPKVYAVDSNNTLRWVPDETTALTLYGTGWANYVIDLEATIFAKYSTGVNMTQHESIDGSVMKTRFELVDTP